MNRFLFFTFLVFFFVASNNAETINSSSSKNVNSSSYGKKENNSNLHVLHGSFSEQTLGNKQQQLDIFNIFRLFDREDRSVLMSRVNKSTFERKKSQSFLSSKEKQFFAANQSNNLPCTAPVPISYGQPITDSLSTTDCSASNKYFDDYIFSGTSGTIIKLRMNSIDFNTHLSLINANTGQLIATVSGGSAGGFNSIGAITLPATGTFLIRASSTTENQTGAYSISVDENVCSQTPISLGQTINASLSTSDCYFAGNYYDRYTFNGTAGQKIIITMNSSSVDAFLQLLNSNNQNIATDNNSGGGTNARITYRLQTSGTYRIQASGSRNQTGDYTISLIDNGICNPTSPIVFKQTLDGILSTSDCIENTSFYDDYTFNGATGQKITVLMDSPDFDSVLELYDSNDVRLTTDNNGGGGINSRVSYTLPTSGTFRIRATSFSQFKTGSYKLTLLDNACTNSIYPGLTVVSSLSETDCSASRHFFDDYIFKAATGEVVTASMKSSTVNAYLELYDSNDRLLIADDNGGEGTNAKLSYTVPASGTYKLRATTNTLSQTGNYELSLEGSGGTCEKAPSSINFGQRRENAISTSDCREGGFYDDYTFNGNSGQDVSISINSTTSAPFLQLYDPNGQFIEASSRIDGTNTRLLTTLSTNGTYTLRVSGNFSEYTVYLDSPTCNSTSINFGQTVNSSLSVTDCVVITNPTQIPTIAYYYDDYKFSGTIGQKIAVQMNSAAFGSRLELYDPDNKPVPNLNNFASGTNSLLSYTLPTNGTYRIRATSVSSLQTGDYTITLSNNGMCNLNASTAFGQTVNDELSTTDCNQNNRFYDDYTFTGTSNQKISVTMNSSGLDSFLELYDSNNQRILSDNNSAGGTNARLTFTLPANGNYRIRATSNQQNQTGAYSISLINNGVCTSSPISYGQTINDSLTATDCSTGLNYYRNYTFAGTAGQDITITLNSTTLTPNLELYSPTGEKLTSTSGTNARIPYSLPSNGTYTIRAGSTSFQTGAFSLSLINIVCNSASINLGQTINNSLSTNDCDVNGKYSDDYTFTLAGQQLSIVMQSTAFTPSVKLYDLNGRNIAIGGSVGTDLSTSQIFYTFLPSGTYRIRATSLSTQQTGAYTLSLLNNGVCNLPASPIAFGQTVNSSLSNSDCSNTGGYYDDYTFTGTTGQKIAVQMNSTAFDIRLMLLDSNGESIASADNSGGGTNARLLFTLPANGTYKIRATSITANKVGNYTLSLVNNGVCSSSAIAFGQTINASLSDSDCVTAARVFYDDYAFSATAGSNISIEMNSSSFTTNLELYNSAGQRISSHTPFSGRNSRILYTLPDNGTYRIRARSDSTNQTGAYTLILSDNVCNSSQINLEQTVNASLSSTDCNVNGRFYDDYTFFASAGKGITVSMNSSSVDAYLELFDSNNQRIAFDNDGGGGTNAQLTASFSSSGTYKIRASSNAANQIGAYSLSLSNNVDCAPQPAGMIAWYKGERNLVDSTGNNDKIGDFIGTYSDGKVGQALNFTGSNNATIFETLTPASTIKSEVTIAAWIKPTSINRSQTIISKFSESGRSFNLSTSGGKLYFQVHQTDTISRSVITTNSVLSAGVYQHVAATFNVSTQQMEIFVNGTSASVSLVNSQVVNEIQGFFTRLALGALDVGSSGIRQRFAGQIDELQIFNRALSSAEIQSIYNADRAGVCNNFIVSGRVTNANGLALENVTVQTSDKSKTVKTNEQGEYQIYLEEGKNHVLNADYSTHSFSPANHSFVALSDNQTDKNFIASLINDNFADAVQLRGESGEIDGSNLNATRETAEPRHADVLGINSVWYKWRAPRSGQFTFSLGGSKFDTLLAVYRGNSLSNLSPVAANDNIPNQAAAFSRLTFQAEANTEYYIAIDGRSGLSGSGFFKLIYHPSDYQIGFTVSGIVKGNDERGNAVSFPRVTIKAETLDGKIFATNITATNGSYLIAIPQGITTFKLTAFNDRAIYGFKLFINISQNQVYNFQFGFNDIAITLPSISVIGGIQGFRSLLNNDLRVTVSGGGVTIQCGLSIEESVIRYVCPELAPFVTYTVTPHHPSFTFTPSSRTYVSLTTNFNNQNFAVNNTNGPKISGRTHQANNALSGVKICLKYTNLECDIETETDSNGNYSVPELPAGVAYKITPSLAGYSFTPESAFIQNLQSDQTVNFIAASDCSYTLSSQQQTIPSEGGYSSFNITTSTDCRWEARTNSAGITITTPATVSSGNGTISYYVEPNNGRTSRIGSITVAGKTVVVNQLSSSTQFDFDGDKRADLSVFREGNWYINGSQRGFYGINWGLPTDKIVPADYDGDGKTDVAVFRNGNWYSLNSSNNQMKSALFGQVGDIPVPADFTGDGKADIAVFRPSNGTWYWLDSSTDQLQAAQFGILGDKPIIGDFDGDGKSDLAVIRTTNGNLFWYWIRSSFNQFEAVQFGIFTDMAVAADYDGDGKTDVSVYRQTEGSWYRLNSSRNNQFVAIQFGQNGDIPVAADYDGDGKADIAVFRAGAWYRLNSSTNQFSGEQFGVSTDKPVPNTFVR